MIDFIKGFIAFSGAIVLGVIFIVQPGEVAEEMAKVTSYGREAGYVAVGYGCIGMMLLFFKIVAPKGRITHILNSMMVSSSMAFLAVLFTIGFGGKALEVWHISQDGVVTDAEVIRNRLTRNASGELQGSLAIRYDGYSGAVTVAGRYNQRYESVRVIYSASRPENVLKFEGNSDLLGLLLQRFNWVGMILGFGGMIIFTLIAIGYFISIFTKPHEEVAAS